MPRGRSRGRGRSNPTAVPVASSGPIPIPIPVVCYETAYDGVADKYTCSDAQPKGLTGDFTYACEVYIEASQPNTVSGIYGDGGNADGAQMIYVSPNILFGGNYMGTNASKAISTGAWQTLVCVNDKTGANARTVYVEGSAGTSQTTALKVAGSIFMVAEHETSPNRFLNGKIRNIEIYDVAVPTPTAWVPGTTTSMGNAGGDLLAQSADGGTTWETGQSVTTFGDPVRQLCT